MSSIRSKLRRMTASYNYGGVIDGKRAPDLQDVSSLSNCKTGESQGENATYMVAGYVVEAVQKCK